MTFNTTAVYSQYHITWMRTLLTSHQQSQTTFTHFGCLQCFSINPCPKLQLKPSSHCALTSTSCLLRHVPSLRIWVRHHRTNPAQVPWNWRLCLNNPFPVFKTWMRSTIITPRVFYLIVVFNKHQNSRYLVLLLNSKWAHNDINKRSIQGITFYFYSSIQTLHLIPRVLSSSLASRSYVA